MTRLIILVQPFSSSYYSRMKKITSTKYSRSIPSALNSTMSWAVQVACTVQGRKVYKVLMGKPERKRVLGRLRRRWQDGIRMDVREIGWGGG
jgi:hypothetical protein